jgi:hypothetical protein
MMGSIHAEELNYNDELSVIEHKKETLEKVLRITHTLNHLLASLESVNYLNQTTFRLPPALLRFYRSLDNRYQYKPNVLIEKCFHDVQAKLEEDFHTLMKISNLSDAEFGELINEPESSSFVVNIEKAVNEYRRRAQTAISLRLILKERGIRAPRMDLDINEEEFVQTIRMLSSKRQNYIEKVVNSMMELASDMDTLINSNTGLSEERIEEMKILKQGLLANIKHLHEGKSIDDLPYNFEVVEAGEALPPDQEVNETEVKQIDAPVQTQEKCVKPERIEHVSRLSDANDKGLIQRTMKWLNSPWNVKWDQVKKEDS